MSIQFDTIDHAIQLQRIESYFELADATHAVLKSYLLQRFQSVLIRSTVSKSAVLTTGVPH